MDPILISIIAIVLLLVLILLRMPIAFALLLSGTVGILILRGAGVTFSALSGTPFSKTAIYTLSVVPMFLLMGQLAYATRVSRDAYDVGYKWLGHIPGGLGLATIAAGIVFGAASGASTAAAAALGKVCVPEMRRYGYNAKLATGIVSAAGLLDILIPPSVGMVIYGVLTGESIGKMLIAGIVPGFVTAANFAIIIFIIAKVRPSMAPRGTGTPWKERFRSLRSLAWIAFLFVVVMGGIWTGAVTPTEGGAVGAFAIFVVAIVLGLRKQVDWAEVKQAFLDTGNITAMLFALFIGAGLFSLFLALAGLPTWISSAVAGTGLSPIAVIVLICLLYIPLGTFLDPNSMMILTLPIFYPLVISLGYNGIWFGLIVIKMIEIGLIHPPVGLNVYVVKSVVPDVSVEDIFVGSVPFLIIEFVTLALYIIFPQIILWLPGYMK